MINIEFLPLAVVIFLLIFIGFMIYFMFKSSSWRTDNGQEVEL